MTAIVLPDIDKKTVDELIAKIPNLREIELPALPKALPKMEDVGKTADEQIDRLLGRSKSPVWPWVAAGVGLVAIIGAAAAYFAFWRKPAWETPAEPWATTRMTAEDDAVSVPGETTDISTETPGLTAAESSLTSTSYNPQEA